MKNITMINGVPITIEMNKIGEIKKASVSNRYIIEPAFKGEWRVTFIQVGDNGPFRSSNCYSDRYNWGTNLDEILNGLAHDGYFPECPEYMRLRALRHQAEEQRKEAMSVANRKKYTDIYWTTKEMYGYESTFDNNVGGCESDFWGVCLWTDGEQDIPCVFCHKNKWVQNLNHNPTLKERKQIERSHS